MTNRFAAACTTATLASALVAACISSSATGPVGGNDAGLCTADGSVTTVSTQLDAGICGACVQSQCGTLLASCASDCSCNGSALQSLGCIESLGATASSIGITSCLTSLGNSTDAVAGELASCLEGCEGVCVVEAGADAAPDSGGDATVTDSATDSPIAESGGSDAADAGADASDAGLDANPGSDASCVTSISGTVYDPAGLNPLPGVSVFTPAGSLVTYPAGATCSCSGLGSPYAQGTVTDANGHFTITGLPEESSLAVVVQTGKWRRLFSAVITPCEDNTVSNLLLPASGSQGTLPDIAVSTGGADSLECLLTRIGVDPAEFVAGASTTGHVHVFNGGNPGTDAGLSGLPEKNAFSGAPASSTSLWDSVADISPYDLVMLSCEGGETYGANPTVLESYLNLGGRVLASHYQYSWFAGALVSGQGYSAPADWGTNLATWTGGAALGDGGTTPTIGATPQTTLTDGGVFYKGVTANTWLGGVGALTSGEVPILTPKYNATVSTANPQSQPWLVADNTSGDPGAAMLFTFDTPVTAAPPGDGGPAPYCGRAAFTDLHDDNTSDSVNTAGGQAPPTGCYSAPLSAQEKELELLLFDLSGCVVADTAAPPTTPP